MMRSLSLPAVLMFAIMTTLMACSVQAPQFVSVKHSRPSSNTSTDREAHSIGVPVRTCSKLTHPDSMSLSVLTLYKMSGVTSHLIKQPVRHKAPIAKKVTKAVANGKTINNVTMTRVAIPASNRGATGRQWLVWLALVVPVWLAARTGKFSNWLHRMLTSKTLLRLLMVFMLLRGYGGYATITRVMMGTEPAFALGIGYANLAFGLVALLLLVMSMKGGLKDLRAIIRGWNAFGFAMLFVSLLVFIAHGMLPAVPFYFPLLFIAAHTLIHVITNKKNYEVLH